MNGSPNPLALHRETLQTLGHSPEGGECDTTSVTTGGGAEAVPLLR